MLEGAHDFSGVYVSFVSNFLQPGEVDFSLECDCLSIVHTGENNLFLKHFLENYFGKVSSHTTIKL